MKTDCLECQYLRDERAAIHEFDGKATRQDAERMARIEVCAECDPFKESKPEK